MPLINDPGASIVRICTPVEINVAQQNNIVVGEFYIQETRAYYLLNYEYYCFFNVDTSDGSLTYNQTMMLPRAPFRLGIDNNNQQYLLCHATQTSVALTRRTNLPAFNASVVPSIPFPEPPEFAQVSPAFHPPQMPFQAYNSSAPFPLRNPQSLPIQQIPPFVNNIPFHPVSEDVSRLPAPIVRHPVSCPGPIRFDQRETSPAVSKANPAFKTVYNVNPSLVEQSNVRTQFVAKEPVILPYQAVDSNRRVTAEPFFKQETLHSPELRTQHYSDVGTSHFSEMPQGLPSSSYKEELSPPTESVINTLVPTVEVKQSMSQGAGGLDTAVICRSQPLSITIASDEILRLKEKVGHLEEVQSKLLKSLADQKTNSDAGSDKQQMSGLGIIEANASSGQKICLAHINSLQGIPAEQNASDNMLATVDADAVLVAKAGITQTTKVTDRDQNIDSPENMVEPATYQFNSLLQEKVVETEFLSREAGPAENNNTQPLLSKLGEPDVQYQLVEDLEADQNKKTKLDIEETVERVDNSNTDRGGSELVGVEDIVSEPCTKTFCEVLEGHGGKDKYIFGFFDENQTDDSLSPDSINEDGDGRSDRTKATEGAMETITVSLNKSNDQIQMTEEDCKPDLHNREAAPQINDPSLSSDITEQKSEMHAVPENDSDVGEAILNEEGNALSGGMPAITKDIPQLEKKGRFEDKEDETEDLLPPERLATQTKHKNTQHLVESGKRGKKTSSRKKRTSYGSKKPGRDRSDCHIGNKSVEYKNKFLSDKINFNLKKQGAVVVLMLAITIGYFYPESAYGVCSFIKECLGDFYFAAISAMFAGQATVPLVIKSAIPAAQKVSSPSSTSAGCSVLAWLPNNIPVPIYNNAPTFWGASYDSNEKVKFIVGMDIPDKVIQSGDLTCRQRKSIKKSMNYIRKHEERINAIMLCGIDDRKDRKNTDCYREVHQFSKGRLIMMADGQPLPPEEAAEFAKLQALDAFSDSPLVAEAFRRLGSEEYQEQGIAIRPVVFFKETDDDLSIYAFHLVPLCTRQGKIVAPDSSEEQQLEQELTFNVHGKLLKGSKVRLELLVTTDAATTQWVSITEKARVSKSLNDMKFTAQVPRSGLFRIKVFQKGDEKGSARDYVCVDGRRMFYYPFIDEKNRK